MMCLLGCEEPITFISSCAITIYRDTAKCDVIRVTVRHLAGPLVTSQRPWRLRSGSRVCEDVAGLGQSSCQRGEVVRGGVSWARTCTRCGPPEPTALASAFARPSPTDG